MHRWMAACVVQLKAARQLQKGASAAGEAQLADTPAAIGSAAEKTAQYISGFYYQVPLLLPVATPPIEPDVPWPRAGGIMTHWVFALEHHASSPRVASSDHA